MSIEQQPHGSRLPFERVQQLFRKGRVEVLLDAYFATHGPRTAHGAFRSVGDEASDRLARLCNDDLFTRRRQIDQPGELSFRLMNIDRGHDWAKLSPVLRRLSNN